MGYIIVIIVGFLFVAALVAFLAGRRATGGEHHLSHGRSYEEPQDEGAVAPLVEDERSS